jgi:hypothetical protein
VLYSHVYIVYVIVSVFAVGCWNAQNDGRNNELDNSSSGHHMVIDIP